MKFGVFGGAVVNRGATTGDSQGYGRFIGMVQEAEALGYHSIFVVEHHFSGSGQVSATLNLLSYLAAVTSRIRLGTAVAVLPWHNPVLLAEQAATVDRLSGGRLEFGVGRGYRDLEFDGFCVPKDEAEARFRESLEVILKSWASDERFDFAGRFWQYRNIVVEPPVVQRPHPPIWMAAGTDQSIARVAESGHNVLFDNFGSIERTKERMAVWRQACAQAGRPFDPMQVALTRAFAVTQSDEDYQAAVEKRRTRVKNMFGNYGALPGLQNGQQPESYADGRLSSEGASLFGRSEQIIARLRDLQSVGFENILLLVPDDVAALRQFAREVMPAFAARADAAE